MDIALVSPPWPLFNRPSIQVGALKAFLQERDPDVSVRAYHPYLQLAVRIGLENYLNISQSSWAAESCFAALLFPDHPGPEKLFYKALRNRFGNRGYCLDFEAVVSAAGTVIEEFLSFDRFPPVRLAGISLCLNQLTAGIYLANKIKERMPEAAIVLGGASCSGVLGEGLLDAFPFVDYTITGEGEMPLLDLWRFLSGKKDGISSRAVSYRGRKAGPVQKEQISDLNKLPPPDFNDYFSELRELGGPAASITPLLPVEASRGCWWSRCNFCNLNLQWKGYRAKSPEKTGSEIDCLSRNHSVLDFAFMDNCLPGRQAPEIFARLAGQGRDYSLFAELRVGHSRADLAEMAAGGLKDIQVGIEALSTSLLKRLGKGSSVIDNLAMMRHCMEWGIRLQANLILHFPGSSDKEIQETLENMDFAWPFSPLKPVSFWLGLESPVCREPSMFGIRGIRPHRFYSLLFPREIAAKLNPLILEYRGDKTVQRRMWKKVEKKVRFMNRVKRDIPRNENLLTFRDGREFLIIRQVLPDGRILRHRLSGLSRRLYLACLEPVNLDSLKETADGLGKDKITAFIDGLHTKRLMFREDDRILSLAFRKRNLPEVKRNS